MIKLFTFISAIPALIAEGYVISLMWLWFIVPTFNIAEVSTPVVVGTLFMVAAIKPTPSGDQEIEYNQELAVRIITSTIMPFFWLGMAYICLQFV